MNGKILKNAPIAEAIFEARVSYRNPGAVKAYLARYPEIEGFIEAAWPALVECFGDSIEIVLEVLTYPSDETIHEELVGWIQSTDDVDEGLAKLERFEDEWYLDHMAEVGHKFNFNVVTSNIWRSHHGTS